MQLSDTPLGAGHENDVTIATSAVEKQSNSTSLAVTLFSKSILSVKAPSLSKPSTLTQHSKLSPGLPAVKKAPISSSPEPARDARGMNYA